ncbi:MAG: hypothetical protein ACRCT7_12725 [Shewanella sp.]
MWSVILIELAIVLLLLLFSWQQWQIRQLLTQDVQRLQATQTLIVVGNEQAQDFATWLNNNPEQIQTLLAAQDVDSASAEPTLAKKPETTPEANVAVNLVASLDANSTTNHSDEQTSALGKQALTKHEAPLRQTILASPATHSVELSEDEHGVKVLLLPHGGIRVTTRQDNQ